MRIVAADCIESRCEMPLTLPVHDKSDILDMVILVAGKDAEQCTAHPLFDILGRQGGRLDRLQCLLTGIRARQFEIEIHAASDKGSAR